MMILGMYNYWVIIALMMIGLYVLIADGNLLMKLIGLSILQLSVFILYISMSKISDGAAPILERGIQLYSNPLPQVLILTAIVVGIATTALALALVVRIKEAYGTIEEIAIQTRDQHDC